MGRRSFTRHEERQEADLSQTLESRLPGIILGLSGEVKQKMSDHVMHVIGRNVPGRPSAESIRKLQYNWLIEHGHMDNITSEQTSEVTEEQDHVISNGKQLF